MNLKLLKQSTCIVLAVIPTIILASPVYQYRHKQSIQSLFQKAIKDHSFPGGCIAAGTNTQMFIYKCFGYFTYAKKVKDTPTSLFDLASLTKVLATTSAIMWLYDHGKLKLNDKVVKYIPQFKGPNEAQTRLKAKITLRDLLAHVSGLPPDNTVTNWKEVYRTPLVAYRDQHEIYSDINFLLLGKVVEKISGMTLNQFTHKYIFKPLGMLHTRFLLPEGLRTKAVPTFYNCETHRYIQGIVSDPMARELQGDTGNAGLFSSLHDVQIFARMMLNQGEYRGKRIFKASTVRFFTKRADILPNSSRALGWDTVYNPRATLSKQERGALPYSTNHFYPQQHQFSAGLYINSNAFGHTGGTSIWISKKYGIFVITLTNRVAANDCTDAVTNERYWRQRIASAVWKNLGFTKENGLYREPLNK